MLEKTLHEQLSAPELRGTPENLHKASLPVSPNCFMLQLEAHLTFKRNCACNEFEMNLENAHLFDPISTNRLH